VPLDANRCLILISRQLLPKSTFLAPAGNLNPQAYNVNKVNCPAIPHP
jgi:hypothetical protein